MGTNTEKGFIEYRYLHCKHFDFESPALTFKFDVNQVDSSMTVAWAVCSDHDNFARAIGRKIVDDRMESGKVLKFDYNRALSLSENAYNGMRKLIEINETSEPNSLKEFFVNDAVDVDVMISEAYRAVDAYVEINMCLDFFRMFHSEENDAP